MALISQFRIVITLLLVAHAFCSIPLSTAFAQWPGKEKQWKAVLEAFGDPPNMRRLSLDSRVWVDKAKQRLIVDGYIALDQGQLEMFACLAGTKEHESVVAVFAKAQVVHAGLLAVGAKSGTPVQWRPYKPPTGSEIQISVLWKDPETGEKKTVDARQWIHQVGTENEVLKPNFVFAGSGMWRDPDSGKELYEADIGGDLVCVSNFATATLDVPMESSSELSEGLLFAAYAGRVPPRGTPVRLVLQVVKPEKTSADANPPADAAGDDQKQAGPDEDTSGDATPRVPPTF